MKQVLIGQGGDVQVYEVTSPSILEVEVDQVRVDDLARKMIRMRGFRPGVVIEIEYERVRPGEKLHEELAASIEERTETANPLIYRLSRVLHRTLPEAVATVEAIEDVVSSGNSELARSAVLRIAAGDGARVAEVVRTAKEVASRNRSIAAHADSRLG